MPPVYDNFARYYDLEYGMKNNDLDFYLSLAQECGDPVLEVGVGTGRVALEFAEQGYRVTGIDNSTAMIDKAREKCATLNNDARQRIKLEQADMRAFSLEQQFQLCVCPFRTLLHNLTMQDQLATLQCVYRHLAPGGVLAFDLFVPLYQIMAHTSWQQKMTPQDLADERSDVYVDINIEHDPVEQLLTVKNTYHHKKSGENETATMKYRYMFRYEAEALLKLAGFQVEHVWGGFEYQPYDFDSGMMIFYTRKPVS